MQTRPDPSEIPDCLSGAAVATLPKGAAIFHAGDSCTQFYYLLSGSVRVDLTAKNGKAIMLYRFGAADTCVLTTSCLLSGETYCANAYAEEETRACVLPFSNFQNKLSESEAFRDLVFASFAKRLTAMMYKIEQVALTPLDARLAVWALRMQETSGPTLFATHEQIAMELGTAREVISRKLSQWEQQGLIEKGRRSFCIVDITALETIAAMGD